MAKQDNKEIRIVFDAVMVWKVIAIFFVAFLGVLFLSRIITPIILIIISFFLAIALNPTVTWIAGKFKSKSRVGATGVAYTMVILFLAGFFFLVFPPLFNQTVDYIQTVPNKIQSLNDESTALGSFVARYELSDDIDKLTNEMRSRVADYGKPALSTAGKIGTTIASTVIVFVLTFMMLVEGPKWLESYFANLSPKHRNHHKKLAKKMYKVIVGFVNGQLLVAVIGGVFAAITLFVSSQIFDVQINAIALGGLVTLFALLPLVGTIIGAALVVLASLLVSLPLAIVMLIYFIVYQQIENVTIQPYIQSRSNTLTPLLVLISALLGVGIGGVLGALLAIPTAGCIKILVDDYFEQKRSKA